MSSSLTKTLMYGRSFPSAKLVLNEFGFETVNEYDCSGDPDWKANLRDYAHQLRSLVNARPALKRLPLLGLTYALPIGAFPGPYPFA